MKFREKWEEFKRVISSKDEPAWKVALAAAVGCFCGTSPTFGIGLVFVYPAARLFKLNTAVAFASNLLLSNPWSTPVLWLVQLWLGFKTLGIPIPSDFHAMKWGEVASTFIGVYIIGALVFGTVLSVLVYGITWEGVRMYRKRKGRA